MRSEGESSFDPLLGGNLIQMYKLYFVMRIFTAVLHLITSSHKCGSVAEIFAPHTGGSS